MLILAGDHIYLMDYQPMLREHVQSGADLTVAVRRVSPHETHRYGIVTVGADDRIVDFQEKPRRSRETLASMGIYVFRKEVLVETLQTHDYVDFGKRCRARHGQRRARTCAPMPSPATGPTWARCRPTGKPT